MLLTYEIRWFYPDRIPEDIQHWFEQYCLIDSQAPPEERSDLYLYSPECEFLGIKLREGRLEVKWLQAELGVVRFGESVEGKVEKWGKGCVVTPREKFFSKAKFSPTLCG